MAMPFFVIGRVFRSPPFRRTTFFWHAPKEGKNSPTQQERWLGQTEIYYKSANFDSTLSSQVKLFPQRQNLITAVLSFSAIALR